VHIAVVRCYGGSVVSDGDVIVWPEFYSVCVLMLIVLTLCRGRMLLQQTGGVGPVIVSKVLMFKNSTKQQL
jgi:hypothetical protein